MLIIMRVNLNQSHVAKTLNGRGTKVTQITVFPLMLILLHQGMEGRMDLQKIFFMTEEDRSAIPICLFKQALDMFIDNKHDNLGSCAGIFHLLTVTLVKSLNLCESQLPRLLKRDNNSTYFPGIMQRF